MNIPTRPKNDAEFGTIKKADKELLSYVAAMQIPHETAFLRWHPEFMDASGRLNKSGKQACGQFFRYNKNKAYMDAYAETLAEAMGAKSRESVDVSTEISESRKDEALKSLLDKAMRLVESGTDLDAESLKVISDIFRKLNLIGDEVETQIRPLRFLPQRCSSCRMRIFVESAVAEGSVLDMCSFCKCRSFAEENGYKFDERDLLDIPKEIIEQIESKNDVSVADILSGKIQN